VRGALAYSSAGDKIRVQPSAEFERYCQTRVDIDGKLLGFDPGAATADTEWVKHRVFRAADTLPNGYCGRPPQQDCPISGSGRPQRLEG
jgi:hypothetical protein